MEYGRVSTSSLIIDNADFDSEIVEMMAQAIVQSSQPVMPIVVVKGAYNHKTFDHDYTVVTNAITAVAARRAKEISPRANELVAAWIVTEAQLPAIAAQMKVLFG